jgi:uncharacterized membrane protein YhaH (DUF805 family)
MDFITAVKHCFNNYANFEGRASRSEYWWFALAVFLGSVVLSRVSLVLAVLWSLGTFVPHIAVAARRLHDTDRSGWFQLIAFVPVVGWIIVLVLLVLEPKEPNRFGAPTSAPSLPQA